MKRVIDGVEYQAINTDNDQCTGCIGNEIGSLSLCRKLRKDCYYKIWKISEEQDDTEQSSVSTNADKPIKSRKPHKHAEAMKLYAEGVATTDKPWELWEFSHKEESHWYPLSRHPEWNLNYNYRRKAVKPKTININGYEVHEPLQNAPDDGTLFWCADVYNLTVQVKAYGPCSIADRARLENGLLHSSMEAAQKHLEALLSFTRKNKQNQKKEGR